MFKEKVRVQILEGKLTDKGKCLAEVTEDRDHGEPDEGFISDLY